MTTTNSQTTTAIAVTLLITNYVILFIVVLSHQKFLKDSFQSQPSNNNSKLKRLTKLSLNWFKKHYVSITIILAINTLFVFQKTHNIALIYNLTIAFSYSLILFHVVLFIKNIVGNTQYSPDFKSQRIYLIYAGFISLSFFLSTTVDNSNAYGTEFQLTLLSWLMLLHLFIHWATSQWKLIRQLQNERAHAQLQHLKSQVNPHFLFNTLNNLYGLALEKSDQTPALILKLSAMLRYTIYQGKNEQVLISDEINYLNDFIELQQIRFHHRVNITFNCKNDDSSATISPLLLLILVENSYKHGVEKLTQDAYVHISLEVTNDQLIFNIKNNFDLDDKNTQVGIGLQNLSKRLALIYPNRHQLDMTSHRDVYSASLVITLN